MFAAAAKSLHLCPTLCDPVDGSLPGFPVPGIFQARTRVGCHCLLQCMKVKSEGGFLVVSDSSRPRRLQPTRLLCPWDFPGKSTGVGAIAYQMYGLQNPLLYLFKVIWRYRSINSSNPWTWNIFLIICVILSFFFQCFMVFTVQLVHLLG